MAKPIRWHSVSCDCPDCFMPSDTILEVCMSADWELAIRAICLTCGEFTVQMRVKDILDKCKAVDKLAQLPLAEMPVSEVRH